MTPTIRVDDEVYRLLQSKAEAFVDTPNVVLRRLLGLDSSEAGSTATPAPSTPIAEGKVPTLLREKILDPGEALVWERRQQGQVFAATVTSGGKILLEDGREFGSPSGAARALAGYEVNGWRVWKRKRDGASLDDLWGQRQGRRREAVQRRLQRGSGHDGGGGRS